MTDGACMRATPQLLSRLATIRPGGGITVITLKPGDLVPCDEDEAHFRGVDIPADCVVKVRAESAAYLAVGIVLDAIEEASRALDPDLRLAVMAISAGIADHRTKVAQTCAGAALKGKISPRPGKLMNSDLSAFYRRALVTLVPTWAAVALFAWAIGGIAALAGVGLGIVCLVAGFAFALFCSVIWRFLTRVMRT